MYPTNTLRNRIAALLAADATTLAHAEDPIKVTLIQNEIPLAPDMVVADLTLFTSNGCSAVEGVAGAQNESIDPLTGDYTVDLTAPAGGFRFETTSTPTDSVTITGAAITDNAGTTLLGVVVLDDPIVLNGTNQSIDLGAIRMRIPATAFGE